MKTRAAVAFAPKQPLEIVELDLEGPKAGEVLVEIMAAGICHTDAYTLDGFDSEGICRDLPGFGQDRSASQGLINCERGRPTITLGRMPPPRGNFRRSCS